jgi:fatty acid desaturase
MAVQWRCILAIIIFAGKVTLDLLHWLVAVLAVIAVASRRQALSVLMHEATHSRLFLSHGLNDAVGLVTARYRRPIWSITSNR